jgi:Tol biopolymer transport system component
MRSLLAIGIVAALTQAPAPNPASPAPFDIYLVPIANGLASLETAMPQPMATAPGYDNQPAFTADGERVLFAANRDGKQTDIYVYTRADRRTAQLTKTATNENSPTPLPDGGFSVVMSEMDKTQRLWKFDAAGKNPRMLLSDIKPVGYHAWIDADRVVLYVLGPPATLQLASLKTGKAETLGRDIGRSLHRIPGTMLASFVQHESSGEYWIKQIDPATKKIDRLVKAVAGSSDRDMAWMPDGKTILMTSGSKVFSWTRGQTAWTEVFDGAAHHLGALSRLSVSPKGDAIAIVVAEPKK